MAYAFENPGVALAKITDEQKLKYQQFKVYKARHTLAGEFHAGVLCGELLMDLLLIVDGVTAIAKIATKVPGLGKLLLKLEKVTPVAKAAGKGAAEAGADAGKAAKKGATAEKSGGKAGEAKAEPTKADKAKDGKAEKDGSHCPIGKPVDAINGCKVLFGANDLDFSLPAPLPLVWQRSYSSDNGQVGWLGQGWHLPISLALEFSPHGITLHDELNLGISFPHLPMGESFYSQHEKITLARLDLLTYELTDTAFVRSQFQLPNPPAKVAHLVSQEDFNANRIANDYNDQQQPTKVQDSAGRTLLLACNEQARLISVTELRREDEVEVGKQAPVTLVEYDYDAAGDLVSVRNRAGETVREFAYKNHIMVKHAQPGALVSE